MDFSLASDQKSIQALVRDLTKREFAPHAAKIDETNEFPTALVGKLSEVGILSMFLPKELDGGGADGLSLALATEELAKGCPPLAFTLVHHAGAVLGIDTLGTKEQKEQFLRPFCRGEKLLATVALSESEAGYQRQFNEASAELRVDYYVVNAKKVFVCLAEVADLFLVLVKAGESRDKVSMIMVEKGTPGLSIGHKYDTMGMRGVGMAELILENCRVPKKNMLGKEGDGLRVWSGNGGSITMIAGGAVSLGIAEAAFDLAVQHARERTVNGRAIGEFPAIRSQIAEMSLLIDTARNLMLEAIYLRDVDPVDPPLASLKSKLYSSTIASDVTNKALQIHGGQGYCKDMPLERFYRDARGLIMHSYTPEIYKDLIGSLIIQGTNK